MALQVDLEVSGDLESEAKRAASAMDLLAKQEQKVQLIAQKLGSEDLKAVSKAIQLSERAAQQEAKAVEQAAKNELKSKANESKAAKLAAKEAEKAAKKLAADKAKAASADKAEGRQAYELIQKLKGGNIAGALELGKSGVAAQALTLALAGAAVAAIGVAGAIAKFALDAKDAKDSALGIMNVLTAGRGDQALKLVDDLASKIGLSLDDARGKFIEFRREGADNTTSANLLKLVADLNQVDSTGSLAKEAIEKTLAKKDAKGNVDIAAATAEMKLLAKQAGVAGDGAKGAQARFTTLGGALTSLDTSKTQALEAIGEKIGPTIDKAAGKVALLVDQFLKSPEGAAAIQLVSDGINDLVDGAGKAVGVVSGFFSTIKKYQPVLTALAVGAGVAGAVFLATMVPAFVATGVAAAAAAIPVIAAAAPFIAIAAAAAGVYYAFTHLDEITKVISDVFGDLGSEAIELGSNIIDGVINGLKAAAGKLFSVASDIGSSVIGSFKSVLGIASPSKAFAALGEFSGEGFSLGLESGAPDAGAVARAVMPPKAELGGKFGEMAPAALAPLAQAPSGRFGSTPTASPDQVQAGAAAGGSPVTIQEINVYGVDPAKEGELSRSVRREVQLAFTSLQTQRGAP